MKLTPISLGTQSNPGRYQHGGVARHVNCRIEEAGDEARVKYVLQVTQGLARFATLDAGSGVKAMLATETEILVIVGRRVFSITPLGVATEKGAIGADGHIFMARNGRESGSQIGIVGNGIYKIYNTTTGVLADVSDPDVLAPTSLCYLGGYFWWTTTAGRFQWSDLDAGDSVDGLSVGTARESPDGLIVCAPRGRDLLLFGTQSLEIWTLNDGSGDAPVSRRTALHGFGALSAGAVVTVNDGVYWLATTDQGAFHGLCTLSGDTPQEINNPAFKRAVQREPHKATITSTVWTEDGRTEIAWSGTDWTWVLDLSTGKMHERSSDGGRWRISKVAHINGKNIAGDATLPRLYEMSQTYFDEDYADLTMICQPPPLHDWPNRVELNLLALDVLPGSGAPADTVIPMLDGDGTPILDGDGNVVGERSATEDIDPQVWLKLSLDGITWSGPIYASMGREQQRLQRVVWHALGTSEGTGYHLQIGSSAAVARALYGAAGDIRSVAA